MGSAFRFLAADLLFELRKPALLLFRGVVFPFVHDLAELVTVLQQSGQEVPTSIAEAARLTRFAVETRYPSLAEAVTREDYDRAVAIAGEVVRWVDKHVSGKDEGGQIVKS